MILVVYVVVVETGVSQLGLLGLLSAPHQPRTLQRCVWISWLLKPVQVGFRKVNQAFHAADIGDLSRVVT